MSLHRLMTLLLSLVVVGCATIGARTNGTSGSVVWQATDLRLDPASFLEKRETYNFTLVLRETQGIAITFTQLNAKVHNAFGSFLVPWEKTGRWQLAAHGELRLPLVSIRYCPYVKCRRPEPLAPEWSLDLTGTDAQGQPVRLAIEVRLPYTP